MKLDVRRRLDPEALAALAETDRLQAEFGSVPLGDVAAMRAAYAFERRFWNAPPVAMAGVEERAVDAAGIATPLRIHRPGTEPPGAFLFYLHGGGWVVGSLDTHDRIMRLLARESGLPVVGVDYALAPETRFPTQIAQIAAVVRAVVGAGPLAGLPFALGGDSAGAHLALAVTAELARSGGPVPFALLLYYGVYGLSDSAARRLWGNATDGLTAERMRFYEASYLPAPEAARDPRFDLLSSDLSATPPAFVLAVTMDPLHDDSLVLATLLEELGREVVFRRVDGVLHGFLHLSRMVPKAMEAIVEGAAFLRRRRPMFTGVNPVQNMNDDDRTGE